MLVALGLAAILGACAQAEPPGQAVDAAGGAMTPDASIPRPDATPIPGTPDAAAFPTADAAPLPTPADAAPPPPDAAPPPPPDAAGGGLFCNSGADCPADDDCCFFLIEPPGFCVVGEEILGVCFPATE